MKRFLHFAKVITIAAVLDAAMMATLAVSTAHADAPWPQCFPCECYWVLLPYTHILPYFPWVEMGWEWVRICP